LRILLENGRVVSMRIERRPLAARLDGLLYEDRTFTVGELDRLLATRKRSRSTCGR
jgi:hypothetical protein